jgi:hypothetical protein
MALEDVRARLQKAGLEPVSDTASSMIARARRDRALGAEVVERAAMKLE